MTVISNNLMFFFVFINRVRCRQQSLVPACEFVKKFSTEVDDLRLSFKKTFAKISFLFFYFVVLHGNLSNKQLFLTFFKFFSRGKAVKEQKCLAETN